MANPPPGGPTTQYSIVYGGLNRIYLLYVPPTPPPASGYPVIIGYHGGGETASTFSQQGLFLFAKNSTGYVQIYPQGVSLTWNCGNGWFGPAANNNVDDVGFSLAVLSQVAAIAPIDHTRVHLTGISLGAEFSNAFAVSSPGTIASLCMVSCALRGTALQTGTGPSLPMPVILVKGDQDPVSPINGGGSLNAPPFSALEQFWETANGTTGSTPSTLFGGQVAVTQFTGGTAPTTAYVVSGMGHQWPVAGDGSLFDAQGTYLGPLCPSPISLENVIIRFFDAQQRV